MKKSVLIIAVLLTGMIGQAQNSITIKSYQKVGWNGSQHIGTDNSTQYISFTSSSITAEGVKASLKSKSGWGNSMGDSYITLYDYNNGTFELYISANNFQLTITSGSVVVDYTGDITQSQINNLKLIY